MGAEVINFQQYRNQHNNVTRDLYTALRYLGTKSESTFKEYERDVKKFFDTVRNKSLFDLNEEDLSVNRDEIIEYRDFLMENYAGNSVNRMIRSVKSVYKELQIIGYEVNHELFSVHGAPTSDAVKRPFVTWDQVEKLVIPAIKYTKLGDKKALLIEFACVTSFRLDSIINGVNIHESFERKDGVMVAKVIGKGGKWDEKSIPESLWKGIQSLYSKYGEELVFHFSETTIKRMMKHIRDTCKIKVDFHSFKKCGIREVKMITNNDMSAMQEQGNHASPATTMAHYDEYDKDFSKKPSLLIGQKIDSSPIDNLSHEELLELIKSDRGLQFSLLNKVKNPS